ncbi:MAG: glycerol-3-phosphate 1-O-acyltransferase PlsY [Candidatus Aminicenantes bacterium]|nr:glycerol-3-phosphate 1-O-acyltransferase PlsY [Candidatus Aminicenantes bacterium]
MMQLHEILFVISSYLLGSIPAGFVIYYLMEKKDIREEGSGNIGATNMMRTKGKKAAIPTLIFDVLKGALPVFYGLQYFDSPVVVICGGAAAVMGHLFPLYIKFKGGKGVASLAGVFLAFNYPTVLVFGVFFLVAGYFTKHVSAGSITGVGAIFFYTLFTQIVEVAGIVFLLTVIILFKHAGNIKKMMAGTENKFCWKENG